MTKILLYGFSLSEHRKSNKELKVLKNVPSVKSFPLPKEEEFSLVKIESENQGEFLDIFFIFKIIAKKCNKLIFVDDPYRNTRRKITPHSRMFDPLRKTR